MCSTRQHDQCLLHPRPWHFLQSVRPWCAMIPFFDFFSCRSLCCSCWSLACPCLPHVIICHWYRVLDHCWLVRFYRLSGLWFHRWRRTRAWHLCRWPGIGSAHSWSKSLAVPLRTTTTSHSLSSVAIILMMWDVTELSMCSRRCLHCEIPNLEPHSQPQPRFPLQNPSTYLRHVGSESSLKCLSSRLLC